MAALALPSIHLISGFSGLKVSQRQIPRNVRTQCFRVRAQLNKNLGNISQEWIENSEHVLDDLSHWISKKVAEKVGPYLPENFEILDWIPSHFHGRIHSVERAATIFVRECLLLGIFYFLFARVERFCRWLNWVYVSNARHGHQMTEDEYESSSFCLMKDPLQVGLVLWEVTRLLHVSGPLFRLRFGLDAVGKVRSLGFIIIITWFLFRWKNLALERLISQHKADAPQLIAFDKVVSLALYYLAGTCIGEVSGLAFRSVLAIGGISGIAVGLAAKEVIGNFLGGTLLFITRPFVIGDAVKAQSFAGFVEDIDFLHTKLVGFDRSPVLVPNQAILKEVIVNYSRAKCRQLNAEFQLRNKDVFLADKITGQITEYLYNHPKVIVEKGTQHPVCYLKAMGTHGLNIELLCFVKEKEAVSFFKVKHEILVQAAHIITGAGASLETSMPQLNAPMSHQNEEAVVI